MTLTKFAFIIATFVFILITAVISYASFNNPVSQLSPIPSVSSAPASVNTVTPKTANSSNASSPAPTTDNRCIIVVDGQRYDVTVYQNQHSGGNIFSCGTDMSSIFHQQHNQRYLSLMAPYKI